MKFPTTRAPRIVTTATVPQADPRKQAAAIAALIAKYQPMIAQARAAVKASAARLAAAITPAAKATKDEAPRVVSIPGRATHGK